MSNSIFTEIHKLHLYGIAVNVLFIKSLFQLPVLVWVSETGCDLYQSLLEQGNAVGLGFICCC